MVPLLQCLLSQTSPVVLAVDSLGHLERDVEVPALDSKVEPRRLVLHKVKRNLQSQTVSKTATTPRRREGTYLGESLLLKVGDDALTDKVRGPDDVEDFVVVLAHEGELESVLGGVDRYRARLGVTIQAVYDLALDASEVDGLLERLDDSVVTADGTTSASTPLLVSIGTYP